MATRQERARRLRGIIHDVVHNQIRDNDPPETAATLERLVNEGHARDQALDLIGHVVVAVVFDAIANGRRFDRERYAAMLAALPSLPDGDEEGGEVH